MWTTFDMIAEAYNFLIKRNKIIVFKTNLDQIQDLSRDEL